jgi:hypothetical protein
MFVIGHSVCPLQAFPALFNVSEEGKSLPEWGPFLGSPLKGRLVALP